MLLKFLKVVFMRFKMTISNNKSGKFKETEILVRSVFADPQLRLAEERY